ncbi:MAG: hypothetical protein JJ892_14120 [Balneola sp.]|nr:hypothetical protein [Balneola sp.]MBO6649877.1 hypothetical protein [Balneola sp.]MBO6712441.1 hypothetical protein [Balneola sp.]MBO6801408.1 hypothetical protein [Balneola sp.]MBO6871778.1 hypothetical protein [Balneola sp.]
MSREQDYNQDLAEIRSMMERSSKFLSLSGLSGVLAGLYALTGAYIAYYIYDFDPGSANSSAVESDIILLTFLVLVLAIGSAVLLSYKKAHKKGERVWNSASKRLLGIVGIPLSAGAVFSLILFYAGSIGLIPSVTLIFYGIALYSAGRLTFNELSVLGLLQIALGLNAAYFIEHSLLLWALGFGVAHIIYGIYIHIRHER